VLVLGGAGGRFDHLLANVLLLASPALADLRISARLGRSTVHVLHGPGSVVHRGRPGDLVTLLPIAGAARSVTTEGLRWRLDGDDLTAGSTRGVSNEMTGHEARVSLGSGTLILIAPDS
jgi:thiamine pyrophosphokinase